MDEHVEAVQRMQDYIATHLDINITMVDLAKVSQYSPWYSYRLFMDLIVWMDIREHFTKSLVVIHMSMRFVLLKSICSNLMVSSMQIERKTKI